MNFWPCFTIFLADFGEYRRRERHNLLEGIYEICQYFLHFLVAWRGGESVLWVFTKHNSVSANFLEIWDSGNYTFLRGVNEFLFVVYTPIVRSGWESLLRYPHHTVAHLWVSWKSAQRRPYVWYTRQWNDTDASTMELYVLQYMTSST